MNAVNTANAAAIREAFARVEEAAEPDRPGLLAALPAEVRLEVESLLKALSADSDFLAMPEDDATGIGSRIGPYTLCDVIGRGGMGIVYRAERQDGEFRRDVAIKIAGGWMFAPEAERRFIRERQILAQLDHPHIVRMLDGGVVRGQRYFVMELVRGVPITEYAKALPFSRRLELFLQVCSAVHHAHQKLVLHRDLKPGNILVTEDGMVKVLDFGIAQLVREETGTSSATQTAGHPLSLSCASPEQLRCESLTLASDIYSLGVLLYELVTGVNPQLRDGDTFQQTYVRVTENSPKAPSKVVSGMRRDFDAIVAKALAREPRERYSSVAELQSDVERYLAHRPVLAVPPRPAYLLTRFVRRNRALTAVLAVILVAAMAGAAAYVRQARREARRFAEARRVIRSVVFGIQPELNAFPATLPLRKRLVEETVRYLEAVSLDAGDDLGLLQEIAHAYLQLARVQGDSNDSNLGDLPGAARSYARAAEIIDRAVRIAPSDFDVLSSASTVYSRRSGFATQRREAPLAAKHAQQSAVYARRAFELGPKDRRSRESYALSLFSQGTANMNTDWDLSVAGFSGSGAMYRELAREFPQHLRNVGLTERYLMYLYFDKKKNDLALEHARRAFAISEQRLAANPTDQSVQFDFTIDASQLGSVTSASDSLGPREALPYFQKAWEIREQILSRDPANARAKERLAMVSSEYGIALRDAVELVRSRSLIKRSLELYESLAKAGQLPDAGAPNFASAIQALGDLEHMEGHEEPACRSFRRAFAMYEAAARQGPLGLRMDSNFAKVRRQLQSCN